MRDLNSNLCQLEKAVFFGLHICGVQLLICYSNAYIYIGVKYKVTRYLLVFLQPNFLWQNTPGFCRVLFIPWGIKLI